jgi:hypothetical protein
MKIGAAGGIRTPDHRVRSAVLYPTELRPQPNGEFTGLRGTVHGGEFSGFRVAGLDRAILRMDPGERGSYLGLLGDILRARAHHG